MSALTTFLIPWLIASAGAAEHRVESTPDAVVVYADRARVTRSFSVDLPSGRQEVQVVNLPPQVMPGTVTADARGPGKLLGVDLQRVTASQVADARVKEIEQELQVLGDRRQDIQDRTVAAQAELTTIQQSMTQSAAALSNQLLVADKAAQRARNLRTTLARRDATVRKKLRTASREQREIDLQIAALQRERANLGSSATDTWNAVVHLNLERAARVNVDLSYLVSGARWSPRYDLRGDPNRGQVELALSAAVQQNTGEDWTDVDLTVSSARPGLGTIIPELNPFFLQRVYYGAPMAVEAAPASRSRARPKASMRMEDAEPAPAPPPPPPMQVAQAKVQVELAATAFTVARPEDIPADGTERKVLLTTEELEAKLRYVTAPRIDAQAYLVGKVVNSTDFPLLAGDAGVFLFDSYLGEFQMRTVPPGESFDVAFGVDDSVRIRRLPVDIEKGDRNLVGKRAQARWQWEVRMRNGHRRSIDMEVHEQIPLSANNDINVKRLEESVEPEELPGGLLKYKLTVPAGREEVLTWGYQVDYPAEMGLRWME